MKNDFIFIQTSFTGRMVVIVPEHNFISQN
jgi:hypothetical protein